MIILQSPFWHNTIDTSLLDVECTSIHCGETEEFTCTKPLLGLDLEKDTKGRERDERRGWKGDRERLLREKRGGEGGKGRDSEREREDEV